MAVVQVEILPWLSQVVAPERGGRLALEVEIQGDRVLDLFDLLADRFPAFAGAVYDVDRRDRTDLVEVAANGRMLSFSDRLNVQLQEGDTITLLPAFIGG